ncbi:hypothetical protein [Metarhizobium album]|uniref:hypothetical protein n=1 Tax=Metarhizobium album TaxID=2182425 RepID=UPI00197F348F|nr:hypothetical protein [Rhizobium album]
MRTVTIRSEIPPEARKACDRPVVLPDRNLTSQETAGNWNKDRTALVACETRRAAAVAAVDATPTGD